MLCRCTWSQILTSLDSSDDEAAKATEGLKHRDMKVEPGKKKNTGRRWRWSVRESVT